MSTKSHRHKTYETLRKTLFCTKGHAEIYIQRPFLNNKISIGEIFWLKIQMVYSCFGAPSTHRIFYFLFEKYQNLNFWWNFKVSWTTCVWANFGNFRQFWVDFLCIGSDWLHAQTLTEILKLHNFWTVSPDITCSVSLESY
jgi:hypothetical protein